MKNYLTAVSLLIVCNLSFADDQVVISKAVDENLCTLVKEDVCKTKKNKVNKKCNQWHSDNAASAGASHVVITGRHNEKSRRPMVDGTYKSVKTSFVNAKYYACPKDYIAESADSDRRGSSPRPKSRSIEERLILLNSLKEKGLINEEEYNNKRSEILSEL